MGGRIDYKIPLSSRCLADDRGAIQEGKPLSFYSWMQYHSLNVARFITLNLNKRRPPRTYDAAERNIEISISSLPDFYCVPTSSSV